MTTDRAKLAEWFTTTATNRVDQGSTVTVVQTRYHKRDLLPRKKKRRDRRHMLKSKPKRDWTASRQYAELRDEDQLLAEVVRSTAEQATWMGRLRVMMRRRSW